MNEQEPMMTDREQTRRWLASARLAERPRGWRRQLRRRLAVTVTGAALLLAMAGMGAEFAARAETDNIITVVNGEVAAAANGKCSLIEAINNANDTTDGIADAPGNSDCAAGNPAGADVIQLPAGGAFSVNKSVDNNYGYSALPLITSTITVEGNNSTITRTGSEEMRFFTAVSYDQKVADLTLNKLTLRNGKNLGYDGGAVYASDSTLTISYCTLSGNETGLIGGGIFATYSDVTITKSNINDNKSYGGGGIYAGYGAVTIIDSTLSGNEALIGEGGGAYLSSATVTINNVFIGGNEALTGGGLMAYGSQLSLVNSMISGNMGGEDSFGGGVYLVDTTGTLNGVSIAGNSAFRGGGMFIFSGSATIEKSTLSGNEATAGGGIYAAADATVSMVNSTLSGNEATAAGGGLMTTGATTLVNSTATNNTAATTGGGVHVVGGTLTLQRSLVTGNTAPDGREVNRAAGTVAVNSHNLFGFGGDAGLVGFAAGARGRAGGRAGPAHPAAQHQWRRGGFGQRVRHRRV